MKKFKQDLVSVDQTVGGTAGIQCEMMFPGIGFGIDFGLMYNLMGAKVNLGEKKIWSVDGYGNERLALHYIQIPLHQMRRHEVCRRRTGSYRRPRLRII